MSNRLINTTFFKTALVIGFVLIPPIVALLLSVWFDWRFNATYVTVQLIVSIMIPVLLPIAILLGRRLVPYKGLIFLWFLTQAITFTSIYLQYSQYVEHPEMFSITEEVYVRAKEIKEIDIQQQLKSVAAENVVLEDDLLWLSSVRDKLAINKHLYNQIMDGSGVLPADSVLIIFERIFLPPGSDPDDAFEVKIYRMSTNSIQRSFVVSGHDFRESINNRIDKIQGDLIENKVYADNAEINSVKMSFFSFLYFTRKGEIITQSVFFQVIETLNEPLSWIVLTLIANNLLFTKKDGL